ncbi:hypothetical protein A9Q78_11420 [Methylophaga sp. 41_12_T18]|nr:hypothetical protein A9Q78_11420 [Methylophaga sp. 41_12_T18]
MKILLADDHGLFRDSMAVWIKHYNDQANISFAADFTSIIDLLNQQQKFDLILLDLTMPGMSGITSINTVKQQSPETPILIVSANDDPQTINACLQNGAAGYVTKASEGTEILKALNMVIQGKTYQTKALADKVEDPILASLSDKQLQLLTYLGQGITNKEIARQMEFSEGTIKQYVSQLLSKLEVDNRTQAANKARSMLAL